MRQSIGFVNGLASARTEGNEGQQHDHTGGRGIENCPGSGFPVSSDVT